MIENRLKKLHDAMAEKGIDALYVTTQENHRYMSGYNNPDGQLLITKNKSYVFADFRYIEAAKRESASCYEVVMPIGRRAEYMGRLLKENEVSTLAYEEENMTVSDFIKFQNDFSLYEIVPSDNIIYELRAFKDQTEIDSITAAQRIAEDAFSHILKFIKYDMTEIEVALELEFFMRSHGAECASFDTICVSGKESSLPHGVPRNVKLERGFLTMDFGAVLNGYHSDMTRTVVIGKADSEMKKLYDTVLKAQTAALDELKAGRKNADMDKIARDIIDDAGYKGCFGHSLGHGVGLQIHESPRLSSFSDGILQPGQVVTVEPGIYIEGKYGCRIEDMAVITDDGKINLTRAPKEMIEI